MSTLNIALTNGDRIAVDSMWENKSLTLSTFLDPEQPWRIGKHFIEVFDQDSQSGIVINTSQIVSVTGL
jgi:hypothetical protein